MNKISADYPLSIQALYVFVGRIFAFLLSFIIPIILVRIFSQEDYGVYQQTLLISMTFIEIVKWGLINSLFYFYPLAQEKLDELLSQTFYLLVCIGLVFLPLLYLLRVPISSLFKSDIFLSLWLPMLVYFFFMLISLILTSIFILEKKSKLFVVYEVVNQSLRILLVIGTAITFRNVYIIIWGLSIFACLRSLVLYVYLKKKYHISYRKIDFSYFGSQIKYSFPIGAARFAGEIGRRADKYILSAFLSSANYAIYSVANMRIPIIELLYSSVGQVVIPKMTEYSYVEKLEQTKRLWHKMIIKNAVITIPAVVITFLLAEHIIVLLYTYQYIESVNIFRIFLLIFLSQIMRPSTVLRSCKETGIIFKSHLYSMLTAVILGYVLIKNYGMIGGAISFVISSYVRTAVQAVKVNEILKTNIRNMIPWTDIKKIFICSLILGLVPLGISLLVLTNLLAVALGGTLYFLSILITFNYLGYFRINKIHIFFKTVFAG